MLKRFENKNYYQILGVSPDATREEISKVYRDLCRIYHPDSNYYDDLINDPPKPEHIEIFNIITLAYNTLSDVDTRARYNSTIRSEVAQTIQTDANLYAYTAPMSGVGRRGDIAEDEKAKAKLLKIQVKSTSASYRSSKAKRKSASRQRFEEEWTQSIPSVSQIIHFENKLGPRAIIMAIFGAAVGASLGGVVYYLMQSL